MEIFNEEQLAGIKKIDFYLITEISNWPVQITNSNAINLVFNSNSSPVYATVDEKTIKEKTTKKETNSGELYEIDLEYNILTRSRDLEQMIDIYQNKPGVAIVTYYSGFRKLFGTNEEPLFLSYGETNGSTVEDKASIDVQIKGVTRTKPVYYSM